MARIRTIKPEFWTSAQVMECSVPARLLFIGIWNFADDAGRMAYSPKTLKAQIFPSDPITPEELARHVDELSSTGLVRIYDVDEKQYVLVTGWKHQRIDKPKASQIPGPVDEVSTTDHGRVPPDPTLRERKRSSPDASTTATIEVTDPEALAAWDRYGVAINGKSYPRNRRGSWHFPTPLPPIHALTGRKA
jgi:hypothetical protein